MYINNIKKFVKLLYNFPRLIGIFLINLYQKYFPRNSVYNRCIYYPTCSEYTKQALNKYGFVRGSLKGIFRILRCNPFAKGGVDYLK